MPAQPHHHRRHSRYGSWQGGGDPLAPPYDVRAVVDELGEDMLSGSSFREAMREMMRRGMDGRRGLDDIADRIRRRRDALRRRGDLSGTLAKVGSALDQAIATEREALAGKEGDEARMAEMELDTLPHDTPGAVRALENYDWTSPEAKEIYDSIRQMLQREIVDAQFEGLRNALSGNDPEAMQAVRDMMADLNNLLAAHARGEDTTDQFNEFMDKHGELFPDNPQDIDELIDSLARRAAAAERMMRSLSPQQREELGQLMSDAMADLDLAAQMAQLRDNLRTLRPGMGQGPPIRMRGQEPLGYGDAVEAVADIADLEALARQLDQDYPGASLDDVDVEMIEQQLGAGVATDLRALRDLERELERQGYVTRGEDGPRLTPRALRRLGETALKRVFADLEAKGSGGHDDHRTGSADELTGQIRPWVFGDDLPVNASATVHNAVMRTLAQARPIEPTDIGIRRRAITLDVEDFAVAETERRTSAAVALCVDLSYSMIAEGRWGPMKQTALALSHLVATRFRQDALQIIGFDLMARRLTDGRAGRGRAQRHAGHQPAARADAGRPAPAPASGRRAGGAGRDRRRADRAPHRGRQPDVPLADHDGDAAGDDGRGGRAHALRRDAELLHAGRGRGTRAVRRRDRPAQRRTGVQPRPRQPRRVRRVGLPADAQRPSPQRLTPYACQPVVGPHRR